MNLAEATAALARKEGEKKQTSDDILRLEVSIEIPSDLQ